MRLVEQVLARLGAVDALVNNAGRAPRVRADLLEASEESFEDLMRTNLQGPYFLTQAIARLLIQRRGAETAVPRSAIVFITSVSADLASANRGEYLRQQGGPGHGREAVRRAPGSAWGAGVQGRAGIIATDMTAAVKESYDARIAGGLVPEGRWGTPEEGRVVAALLRGDVPYATGTIVHVDGGLTIPRLWGANRPPTGGRAVGEPPDSGRGGSRTAPTEDSYDRVVHRHRWPPDRRDPDGERRAGDGAREPGTPEIRLMTLDPGHFHAALVQKEMYPDVSPNVHVFAPLGPDLIGHLDRIAAFNAAPTTRPPGSSRSTPARTISSG